MLSERTGLGPLELAVLCGVEADAPPGGRFRKSSVALARVEDEDGYAAAYTYPVMADLGVPWQVHLRLLDLQGNWGSPNHDSPADPQYTEVRLSDLGALALASERGELGPVPVGLIDGSAYRGGSVPSLDPVATLPLLQALVGGGTLEGTDLEALVGMPSGGVFLDGLADLVAGRPARVACSCRILRERDRDRPFLVVTETPPGVGEEAIEGGTRGIIYRAPGRRKPGYLSDEGFADIEERAARSPFRDVRDETNMEAGTRIVIEVAADADLDRAEELLRTVWPVTVDRDWHIPGGLAARLTTWADRCRADPSGLDALAGLVLATGD